jgi:hypothetical protein
MSEADSAYNYDRYRRLLAEAVDETKRLAFIELLIKEKARDRLAAHLLRTKLTESGHPGAPSPLVARKSA